MCVLFPFPLCGEMERLIVFYLKVGIWFCVPLLICIQKTILQDIIGVWIYCWLT